MVIIQANHDWRSVWIYTEAEYLEGNVKKGTLVGKNLQGITLSQIVQSIDYRFVLRNRERRHQGSF